MSVSNISEIKLKLKKAGFYTGIIDDEVNQDFTSAVAHAQRQLGTFADGMYGPATDRLLDRYLKEHSEEI